MAKNKQEDIFDAAMQLFAERGYDGTTIPMIAEKAKVGAGTIYRYFENKEALVNSLFSKSMLELSEMIKTDFPVEANIREQFSHTYNRLFEFARNNVDAFLFTNSHCDSYFLDEQSKKIFDDFIGFFMNIIEDGIAKGFLRPLPPVALIIIVYQPLEALTKVIATGQLEYSKELVTELEESSWNAIRII
ncbi:TetR/AcrR family transcriptional regulator [Bacillus thuringiensis]|uniref:TetR/AcrR family transcriptional regulator n=1 Tax=Bacillus thuringiensis TaxID=1428 RepID=UPI000BFC3B6A|nr:TetR/AcrR family transcriptional regulator [Bacillus thuringiensis]PGL71886.1 TetR family transcriptional regulator [Bacillus thuringiensis]